MARTAHEIRDHSYVVQRTLSVNHPAVLTEDAFYGHPIPAGTRVWVLHYTNAGFRGIDALVGLADGEQVTVSAGLLAPWQKAASEARCRYADCVEGHPVATEAERVTCPTCRRNLGLREVEP